MADAPPVWKSIVDRADAKAGEGDWATASRLLAEARGAGAADRDFPKLLLDGVTRYLAPPVLKVIEPAEGARLTGTTVHISGTLTSNRPTDMVELNGQVVLALEDGKFELDWNGLTVGANRFEFRVVDGDEERAKIVRSFTGEARTEVYAGFLKDFAVAVGAELDATTGYPKKIRRLKDDGEMVLIPAGTFQMGAVPGDSNASDDERPRHRVTLAKAYYLDVNEVTVGQWEKFGAGGGDRTPTDLRSEASDRHPIHNVDHAAATAFAMWAGASLPTEAQWECAAKGGHDDSVYPWGASDDVNKRNGWGSDDGFAGLAPVRSFHPNGYGLHDMMGNVCEWCSDWYESSYYAPSPGRDPSGPRSGSSRVARGGSWVSNDVKLRASDRLDLAPTYRSDFLGLRLARSL
jgi:formylglycine-generating enzyme required for sulfatase activity